MLLFLGVLDGFVLQFHPIQDSARHKKRFISSIYRQIRDKVVCMHGRSMCNFEYQESRDRLVDTHGS
jgi:hypothetical protein